MPLGRASQPSLTLPGWLEPSRGLFETPSRRSCICLPRICYNVTERSPDPVQEPRCSRHELAGRASGEQGVAKVRAVL